MARMVDYEIEAVLERLAFRMTSHEYLAFERSVFGKDVYRLARAKLDETRDPKQGDAVLQARNNLEVQSDALSIALADSGGASVAEQLITLAVQKVSKAEEELYRALDPGKEVPNTAALYWLHRVRLGE